MKILKWVLILIVVLGLLGYFFGMPYIREQTKKNSPEKTATYAKNELELTVHYSSPLKKGRVIFGELVPYNKVWRTGANEPTTFTTATDMRVMGKVLPAGTYSLWTIPGEQQWSVIFNKEVPDWGVTILSGGKDTTRDPSKDIVQVEVPSTTLAQPIESFTIEFEDYGELNMGLSWDQTKITVPLSN